MPTFEDDDPGYLRWLQLHPNGYVLNYKRPPEPTNLKLHNATCADINGTPHRGHYWTVLYGKICSDSRRDVERQARYLGGEALPCVNCFR
jgi:hypothetical protein